MSENKTSERDEMILDLRVEMIVSLMDAVGKAHGATPWHRLKEMTVQELVNRLAQNGIRFHYDEEGVVR